VKNAAIQLGTVDRFDNHRRTRAGPERRRMRVARRRGSDRTGRHACVATRSVRWRASVTPARSD